MNCWTLKGRKLVFLFCLERLLIEHGDFLESRQFLQGQVGAGWPAKWSGREGKEAKGCRSVCVPSLYLFMKGRAVGGLWWWGFGVFLGLFFFCQALSSRGIVQTHGCQCSCHHLCERRKWDPFLFFLAGRVVIINGGLVSGYNGQLA